MTLPASLFLTNNSDVTDLEFEVYIDDEQCYSGKIPLDKSQINFEVAVAEGLHTLTFVLKGKEQHHTTIDAEGNITKDVLIKVSDVTVDDINIDQILFNQAEYKHDYNGNGPETVESYLGVLGCNGKVTLPFESPVYIWILENI